jgi:hypothetical protein
MIVRVLLGIALTLVLVWVTHVVTIRCRGPRGDVSGPSRGHQGKSLVAGVFRHEFP